MSIHVAIHHLTEYRFDRQVNLSPHVIRLRPAPHTRTPLHRYSLQIEPAGHFINWQQDPFGNYLARVNFPERTGRLLIEVDIIAELVTINPFDFFTEEYADRYPFAYEKQLKQELAPYFEIREHGPQLREWIAGVDTSKRRIVDFLVMLNQALNRDIGYVVRMEPGIQSCEETLQTARGSCRDTAWLLVQIVRHLGLAARFVSGYLVQLVADVKSLDGPSGPAADFTDLHAWAEVYVPGAGWIGLDPTSGLFAAEGHIPLACTPDPVSAAPVTGSMDECEVEFRHDNRVTRIHEDPRVTRPYSDRQWEAVLALGEQVDREIDAGDMRLTMGGEPTFVSIDDMDSPEWNIAALGEHKRERAEVLLRRLWQCFAKQGVLHHGQGKWYPGEPLPRWALSVYWRRDGRPVWQEQALLADPRQAGTTTTEQALAFARTLAENLGVSPDFAREGYEDGWYYLWKEGILPANVNVLDNKLKNPLERERLRRVFEQGLDHVVGYALPLSRDHDTRHWTSSRWQFRRGHLFLLPGDSPMGLRLPLDALLYEPDEQHAVQAPTDPFAVREPLVEQFDELRQRYRRQLVAPEPRPGIHEQGCADSTGAADVRLVRSALCVEVRNGVLYVFLPPLMQLEHWLDLVNAVEETARMLRQPLVLEGYPPPVDERLLALSVTPDPGVIEVNIHPAGSWGEIVANTELLYEQARLSRLGTEKFMLDGRHTGTGGGNHITLGGPAPADSPVLRRPELLSSLLLYWQNHPGLSYLFSGLFVGPTSQAPRIDEARDDSLYELEIALQQLPQGDAPVPWLADRILRNLLVDMTGNTHRAEFCIDKLYSPDSVRGRLGLVEFRAFEMPPHARMSLVQVLLLRILATRFWTHPYRNRPVRWGTELHDRFMLPHFVRRDLDDVVDDLNRWGYGFRRDWLDPFFEFRFPRYGTTRINDIGIELRLAIEPWHVLGEEVSAQGTARYVDSSVERLQVRVTGMTESRHLLLCNGQPVLLHNTGTRGEFVAGVRYKAWQPSSGLHPTLPIHAPLVFDLVDRWCGRSLGGCTYHVSHPGGCNPDTFPVNASAAEARRMARFWSTGHTPGPLDVIPACPHGDHPWTTDLRYGGA